MFYVLLIFVLVCVFLLWRNFPICSSWRAVIYHCSDFIFLSLCLEFKDFIYLWCLTVPPYSFVCACVYFSYSLFVCSNSSILSSYPDIETSIWLLLFVSLSSEFYTWVIDFCSSMSISGWILLNIYIYFFLLNLMFISWAVFFFPLGHLCSYSLASLKKLLLFSKCNFLLFPKKYPFCIRKRLIEKNTNEKNAESHWWWEPRTNLHIYITTPISKSQGTEWEWGQWRLLKSE